MEQAVQPAAGAGGQRAVGRLRCACREPGAGGNSGRRVSAVGESRVACSGVAELPLLLRVALPAVAVYMINYVMFVATQIFCGQLGNLELAAASLGTTGVQAFAYGLLVPRDGNGQAYGAHRYSMLGVYMQCAGVLLAATGIPLAVVYAFSERVLVLLGESPEIAGAAAEFAYGLVPQIYAASFPREGGERAGGREPRTRGQQRSRWWVVTSLSLAVAVVCAVVVFCLRDRLSYFFTGGEAVARAVSDLCPLLAVTIVLNGVQPVLSGVAVGCGWQAYVNVGCYYILRVPLGVFLGFYLHFGAKGVWSGMVIGGTLMQTLILLWFTFRTDWNKEVKKAKARLAKWEDETQPLLQE
ncbi:hypothetical protein QOZ80_7BG0600980 [Eleusine coracana subsp. coracana]|nr:hypothetical protein QOZ80_7BG0600980 [Eleusine coracana subsp. coracana]